MNVIIGLNRKNSYKSFICKKFTDTPEHILLTCDDQNVCNIRNAFYKNMSILYPSFSNLNISSKLRCILNLQKFDDHQQDDSFRKECVLYVKEIIKLFN